MDDKKFGLPKQKKYPMPDAAHVRSAIKFFNYVTPANEQELATAILARMKEYGISPESLNVGDENRFKKYIQDTYLEHHGILGQKWGVRRFQNPDGTRTVAGKRRAQENQEKESSTRQKGLSDKTKSRIKTGAKVAAAVTVAGLAAYGLHKSGGLQNGMKAVKTVATKSSSTVPKKTTIAVKRAAKKPSSATQAIIAANKVTKANMNKSMKAGLNFVYAQPSSSMQATLSSLNKSTQSTIDFTEALIKQFS